MKVIVLSAHRESTGSPSLLQFRIDPDYGYEIGQLIKRGHPRGDYYRLVIELPGHPRSTGPHSQSNCFHGICRKIAFRTGNLFESVKMGVKVRAMEERNYPGIAVKLGSRIISVPKSEGDATDEEERILIEMAKQVAAEEGADISEVVE